MRNQKKFCSVVICGICGSVVERQAPSQRYCYNCSLVRSKEVTNKAQEAYRRRKGYGVREPGCQTGTKNNNWKNGIGSYGKLRGKESICSKCGEEEFRLLCVHHINEDRTDNDPKNLIVICRSCHSREHKLENNFGDPRQAAKDYFSRVQRKFIRDSNGKVVGVIDTPKE